jgi:hypothetical protein
MLPERHKPRRPRRAGACHADEGSAGPLEAYRVGYPVSIERRSLWRTAAFGPLLPAAQIERQTPGLDEGAVAMAR